MNRRGFLRGLIAAAAAPAIITTPGLLMPVKPVRARRLIYPIAEMVRVTDFGEFKGYGLAEFVEYHNPALVLGGIDKTGHRWWRNRGGVVVELNKNWLQRVA